VQFHEQVIGDLLEDPSGGLVVLSAGLGLPKLVFSLLGLHDSSQGSVLILNATNSQKNLIDIDSRFSSITAELQANQRLSLYTSGGIFFITARILIVDLLTQRLPTTAVAGIILLNAHSLSDTSTEAFIVRIMRSSNRSLYVRAFSDRPQAMVSGFAKAERLLKCLFLRKLHLWPRFQVYVSQELEKDPPEVIDIRVPMSSHMVVIQKTVIEVMDACLKEMRKTNKVDVEDLTVESGLFKSFDEILRRQLDPIWHTLGKRTKQLVSDLKTLRKLLDYLVRYDAVTYLKYLDSLRASESFRSVWILAESSYNIFEYAKKRVYQFGRLEGSKSFSLSKAAASSSSKKRKHVLKGKNKDDASASTDSGVGVLEILEEPTKWKAFHDILIEIQAERKKQEMAAEEAIGVANLNGIILVACKDEFSCMQLQQCIAKSPNQVMRDEWEKYLLSKVELQALPKSSKKKHKEPLKGFGILDGVIPSVSGQNAELSISKQENDVLLALARDMSKRRKKTPEVKDDEPVERHDRGKKNEKRMKRPAVDIGKIDPEPENTMIQSETSTSTPLLSADLVVDNTTEPQRAVLRKHDQGYDNGLLRDVHFHALDSDQNVIDIRQPSVVIFYHPHVPFVREIEVYKSEHPSKRVKVYFLFYDDSTEVQKFEASVRRENASFESLIRQKSLMMIPTNQDEQFMSLDSALEPQSLAIQNSMTRKAGGRKEVEKQMKIIVDMREFMSSLPNVLHQKGIRIIPVTLEVGDYILSPCICVERKSIQDLFGSFSSGRLYHQVEMMTRHYKIPVLLIEFSQDKSFSFQVS
ncbi:hypothetical protein M569_13581, partial [Genlisea aurea]